MAVTFLSIQKLRGKDIYHVAARHNLREFIMKGAGEHGSIDIDRTPLNYILRGGGSSQAVANRAQELMAAASTKPLRKDAVMALEVVMSLPPDTNVDVHAYFEDAVQWVEGSFGVPVLSAVVHLDQSSPHCHVLLLPLVDNRMVGSDLMGGRAALAARQDDYFRALGARYGLGRPPVRKRPSKTLRQETLRIVGALLRSRTSLQDTVVDALLAPHASDPLPLAKAMGVELDIGKRATSQFVKTMTQVCTSNPASMHTRQGHTEEVETL
jgi:hypothetical protein